MTRRNMSTYISKQTGLTQKNINKIVDHIFEYITKMVTSEQKIQINRFGSFFTKIQRAKKGRNPRKPDLSIDIPERIVLKFQPCKKIKQCLINKSKRD